MWHAYVTALMVTSTFVWSLDRGGGPVQPAAVRRLPGVDDRGGRRLFDGVLRLPRGARPGGAPQPAHCARALRVVDAGHRHQLFVSPAFTGSVNGFVSVWLSLFLAAYFAFGSHSTAMADEPAISQYGPVGAASQPQQFMSPELGGGFQGFGGGSTNLQPPPNEVGAGI